MNPMVRKKGKMMGKVTHFKISVPIEVNLSFDPRRSRNALHMKYDGAEFSDEQGRVGSVHGTVTGGLSVTVDKGINQDMTCFSVSPQAVWDAIHATVTQLGGFDALPLVQGETNG